MSKVMDLGSCGEGEIRTRKRFTNGMSRAGEGAHFHAISGEYIDPVHDGRVPDRYWLDAQQLSSEDGAIHDICKPQR
jgi:hypothetical protein